MSKYDEERKKIQKYLTEVIGKIILIILYFIASTAVLYGCKVSASGTIPTNGDYYPFTDDKKGPEPVYGEKISNIFTTIFLDPNRSEKISFTDLETRKQNNSSWMIDLVRSFAEKKQDMTSGNEKKENMTSGNEKKDNTTCFKKYIWNVLAPLVSFDYKMLVGVLKYMHDNLWEWLIVAGGPIFMTFVLFGLVILNFGYFSFLWFANMVLFFEYNDCQECTMPPPKQLTETLLNNALEASPAGQAVNMVSNNTENIPGLSKLTGRDNKDTPLDTDKVMCDVPDTFGDATKYGIISILKVILFVIIFFMGLGVNWFLQIFIIVSIFLSIVSFVSKIEVNDKSEGGKDGSFKVVMWKLFRFYKVIITFVIVYMMIKLAKKDLSGPAAYGAFAAVAFIGAFSLFSLFIRRDIPSMTQIIEKPVEIPISPSDVLKSSEKKGGGNRKGGSKIYCTNDINQLIKNIKKVSKRMKAM
jgi:hypothetical protein